MSNKTLWSILGVTILVFIGGLIIGLWTIPVKAPATESTPQTSASTSVSGNAKAAEKAQEADSGEMDEQSGELTDSDEKPAEKAQEAESGEKIEQLDDLTDSDEKSAEDENKGGEQ